MKLVILYWLIPVAVSAQILQPKTCWGADDACAITCKSLCDGTGYVTCQPCDPALQQQLNLCKIDVQNWKAANASLQTERDSCAAALQSRYNKDKTQKACVTKTAPATAKRCFP